MLAFNQMGNLGRLGNQMFQYAAVRGIAAMRGYEFGIPPFESKRVDNYSLHRAFTLDSVGTVSYTHLTLPTIYSV